MQSVSVDAECVRVSRHRAPLQVGFGIRNTQGGNRFYARHGAHASLMGQMVKDAQSAVDVLLCRSTLRHTPQCYDAQGTQPSSIPYVVGEILVYSFQHS